MDDETRLKKDKLAGHFQAAAGHLPDRLTVPDMAVFFCGLMDAYELPFEAKKQLVLLVADQLGPDAGGVDFERMGVDHEKLH